MLYLGSYSNSQDMRMVRFCREFLECKKPSVWMALAFRYNRNMRLLV